MRQKESDAQLDYRPVDSQWKKSLTRIDPRRNREPDSVATAHADDHEDQSVSVVAHVISGRIVSNSAAKAGLIRERWPFLQNHIVRIIVQGSGGSQQHLHWAITSTGAERAAARPAAANNHSITLATDSVTWQALLDDKANVDSEKKARRLRYTGTRNPMAQWDETHAVAALLGLASVPMSTAGVLPMERDA